MEIHPSDVAFSAQSRSRRSLGVRLAAGPAPGTTRRRGRSSKAGGRVALVANQCARIKHACDSGAFATPAP